MARQVGDKTASKGRGHRGAATPAPGTTAAAPTRDPVEAWNEAARSTAAVVVQREQKVARSKREKRERDKMGQAAESAVDSGGDYHPPRRKKLDPEFYEAELARLSVELVKLQEWVRARGLKIVVLFEGRDAAGKGGVIKTISAPLNPRVCRVVALGIPTEREKTQWYFQRYVAQLPAAGEIALFDRSWYNRALVEHVMGFCSRPEYEDFLRTAPEFERMLIRSGVVVIKYWFSVSDEEQEKRFQDRLADPTKRWKLSPMDVTARSKWVEYSKAKDAMFAATDVPGSPWWVVEADDKKRARLNCISHLLSLIPYEDTTPEQVVLPDRQANDGYVRPPLSEQTFVPELY